MQWVVVIGIFGVIACLLLVVFGIYAGIQHTLQKRQVANRNNKVITKAERYSSAASTSEQCGKESVGNKR